MRKIISIKSKLENEKDNKDSNQEDNKNNIILNENNNNKDNLVNTENNRIITKNNDVSNVEDNNKDSNLNNIISKIGSNENVLVFPTNNLINRNSTNEKSKTIVSNIISNSLKSTELKRNANRTMSIHESVNSLLSKNVVKVIDSKNTENNNSNNNDDVLTLPSIKSYYNYRTGFKEQFYNILSICSRNNSLKNNIETRQFLVEEVLKDIDLINIVGKMNQLSKMFEIFAFDKYKNENSDPNIQFDEYYNQIEDLMKSKRVFS